MNVRDIALRAQVSIATVSRVLNDPGLVKERTRTRVLEAMREVHYHPNLLARALVKGENRCLGIVASNLHNPFYLEILSSLKSIARMRGYHIAVANTNHRPSELVSSARSMIGQRVAGLALFASESDPALFLELEESGLPVIVCGMGTARSNISIIAMNYVKGMRRVVRYLRSLGHRRLAFVCHDMAVESAMERKIAFLDATSDFPDLRYTAVADSDDPRGGQQATRQLLASGFRATAIISQNDFMALGVLRAVREHGLRVPEEISVTGYDNITLSEFASPSLTTVEIPRKEIADMTIEALVGDEGGIGRGGRTFVIDHELVVRESTGPVRPQFGVLDSDDRCRETACMLPASRVPSCPVAAPGHVCTEDRNNTASRSARLVKIRKVESMPDLSEGEIL
jgi:DNA-binding LacI/PurR family transcriptional regulator